MLAFQSNAYVQAHKTTRYRLTASKGRNRCSFSVDQSEFTNIDCLVVLGVL